MLSTNGSYRVHKHRYHKQSDAIHSHAPAKLDNTFKQHDNIMRYLVTRYPVTTASRITPAYSQAMPTMQRYQAPMDNIQASNAAIYWHTGMDNASGNAYMDNAIQNNYQLVPISREPEGPASKIVAIATIAIVGILILKKMEEKKH
jgi:hypothetical protein